MRVPTAEVRRLALIVSNVQRRLRPPWSLLLAQKLATIRAVELTDDSGGEKFSRHRFGAGDVVLGDRGYATARGVWAVRQQEAHMVVRFNPATFRTCDEKRRRIYLAEKETGVPKIGATEFKVTIPVPPRAGEVIWLLTTLPARQMPGSS